MAVDENLAYTIGQSETLKELLETVSGRKIKMPTRYKFMSTLDSKFHNTMSELKDILSKQKYLCLTADVWSSRAQSYLGVTVHFLNSTTHKRESYLLAFKQIFFRRTYDELAKAMHDIFNKYDIKVSQITNIVTDGGSAFCKMFKKFGSSIDAVVTTYGEEFDSNDDIAENLQRTDSDDVVRPFMEDGNGELFYSEVLDFNLVAPDHPDDAALENYVSQRSVPEPQNTIKMPPQRRCLSHELNLLSKDFEKTLTGMAQQAFNQKFEKFHSLWVLTHRSSHAKTICQMVLGRCLKIPNDTRWNSRFDAAKVCCEPDVESKLNLLIERLKLELKSSQSAKNLNTLTIHDFSVIKEFIRVMEPVAQSLDAMQREKNSSQGFIIPVLLSMKFRITKINETSNIAKDFKSTMLAAIHKRFQNYFVLNESNKDLVLASITMPKVKTNFIANDDDLIYAKNLLISESKKLNAENLNRLDDVQNEVFASQEDDFIISFGSHRSIRRNSFENDIESEVSRYICDIRTDDSILNEYPNVREVYFKYNTTLSSSAPVERVFSQSLMIFTPRRNRLSATHFEQTLLLKHNRKLIRETKNH